MSKPLPDIIYKIDERSYYDKFARKLISHFRSNLDFTNVGTGTDNIPDLKNSMKYRLYLDSNRRINRITLEYDFVGLFIDLGVGRGVPLDDIGYQKIGRTLLGRKVKQRRAKRWYLKTIHGQTIRLMNIVSAQRGHEFTVMVDSALHNFKKININI